MAIRTQASVASPATHTATHSTHSTHSTRQYRTYVRAPGLPHASIPCGACGWPETQHVCRVCGAHVCADCACEGELGAVECVLCAWGADEAQRVFSYLRMRV